MNNIQLEQQIKTMQETLDTTVKELHARDEEIKKLKDAELENRQKLEELKTRMGVMTYDPVKQKQHIEVERTRITTHNVGDRIKESGLTEAEQADVLKKMS